jgi:hypothetical protein
LAAEFFCGLELGEATGAAMSAPLLASSKSTNATLPLQ